MLVPHEAIPLKHIAYLQDGPLLQLGERRLKSPLDRLLPQVEQQELLDQVVLIARTQKRRIQVRP